jgi:hypothetical protein
MALTPATVRADRFLGNNKKLNCGPGSKPCGNACIPKDHKCRASWNKPVKVAAGAAALTGVALVGTAILHPRAKMREAARGLAEPMMQAGFGVANVARGNWVGAAKNAANVGMAGRGMGKNLRTVAEGYGTDIRNGVNRAREAGFKWKNHRPAKRRDSVWAEGFEPRTDAGVKCGGGYIAQGKKCKAGAGAAPTGKPARPRGGKAMEKAGNALLQAAHVKKAHDQFNFSRTPGQQRAHEAAANTMAAAGSVMRSQGQGRRTAARRNARAAVRSAGQNLLLRALS